MDGQTQISFDPLDFGENHVAAKRARDIRYRYYKAQGVNVYRWTLRNQLRPYAGFGIPDGRIRDVYYLQSRDGTTLYKSV